jgi:hypothetical protein
LVERLLAGLPVPDDDGRVNLEAVVELLDLDQADPLTAMPVGDLFPGQSLRDEGRLSGL